jgi:hypothetical protein
LTHVDDVESYVFKAVGNIFHWHIRGKVTDYCLDRLFRMCRGGKILELFFSR